MSFANEAQSAADQDMAEEAKRRELRDAWNAWKDGGEEADRKGLQELLDAGSADADGADQEPDWENGDLEKLREWIRVRVRDVDWQQSADISFSANPPLVPYLFQRTVTADSASRWLPWLPKATTTILTGDGGAGKTTLALQIAASVASGGKIAAVDTDETIDAKGPKLNEHERGGVDGDTVIYASWETRPVSYRRRLADVCGGWWQRKAGGQAERENAERRATEAGKKLGERLIYRDMRQWGALWGVKDRHTSTVGSWMDAGLRLKRYAEERGASLLVIDPLAAAFMQNENDRALVRAFLSKMDSWADLVQCTVLILAHPPKTAADYSGSTDWRNGVQCLLTLQPAQVKEKRDGNNKARPSPASDGTKELKVDKMNDGPSGHRCFLRWEKGRMVEVNNPQAKGETQNNGARDGVERGAMI